jgi:hypothetical protein
MEQNYFSVRFIKQIFLPLAELDFFGHFGNPYLTLFDLLNRSAVM